MTSSQDSHITRLLLLQTPNTAFPNMLTNKMSEWLRCCGLNSLGVRLILAKHELEQVCHVGNTEFLSIGDATTNLIVKEGHKHYLYKKLGQRMQF